MSTELIVDSNYEQLVNGSVPLPVDGRNTKPFFSLESIKWDLNHLLGDVLTLLDASIVDAVQRKAMKDLMKQKFWARMNDLADCVWKDDVRPGMALVSEGKKKKA